MKFGRFLIYLLLPSFTFASNIEQQNSDWQLYTLDYQVIIPKPTQPFKHLEAWIPLPRDSASQKVIDLVIKGLRHEIGVESKYANKMAYFKINEQDSFPVLLNIKIQVKRKSEYPSKPPLKISKKNDPKNFLQMNRKVPINGLIAKIAAEQVNSTDDKWTKTEKLYDYTVRTMSYDKSEDGWGQGDAVWACSSKKGNCTDFHSLLIGMARSQNIPAQFQIGLPVPPSKKGEIPGYHCWARIYDQKRGWFPVDASESKKSNDYRKYFGYLPPNRIHFTTGRDIVLMPKQSGPPLNYFIYPYLELDGKIYSNYKKKFMVSAKN